MTTRFSRHGDILAVLVIIEDADHLAEPWLLSKTFQVSPFAVPPIGPPCITTFEGVEAGASVPHYLPEKNPFVDEMTKTYGVPKDAVVGMPETLYWNIERRCGATGREIAPAALFGLGRSGTGGRRCGLGARRWAP